VKKVKLRGKNRGGGEGVDKTKQKKKKTKTTPQKQTAQYSTQRGGLENVWGAGQERKCMDGRALVGLLFGGVGVLGVGMIQQNRREKRGN